MFLYLSVVYLLTKIFLMPSLLSSANCNPNVKFFIPSTCLIFLLDLDFFIAGHVVYSLMLKIDILYNIFCIFNPLIHFNIACLKYFQSYGLLAAISFVINLGKSDYPGHNQVNCPIKVCANTFLKSLLSYNIPIFEW